MHRVGWALDGRVSQLLIEAQSVLQVGVGLDVDPVVAQSARFLLDHCNQVRGDAVAVAVRRHVELLEFGCVVESLEDIHAATAALKAEGDEDVYVVTCFSDRDKVLSDVEKEGN